MAPLINVNKIPGKCDVCNSDCDDLTIAELPGTPLHVAYCAPCIAANAHPFDLLVLQVAMCGGADAVLENVSVDYIPLIHDTLDHLGRSLQEFEEAVNHCKQHLQTELAKDKANVDNDNTTSTGDAPGSTQSGHAAAVASEVQD